MKGFALDKQGDLLIENGEIQMVHGADLTRQTIRCVLGTKKGEWFFDRAEGIDHDSIIGKLRYASQNNAIDNQYIREISEIESEQSALAERLAKRLDGEL